MTTQLIMGGIALAGVFALSLGRKGDTEDEVIDAVADAAIAALNVDKDALEEVLADAVEQGDEAVMVIVIEEIGVIDDKIADIVVDAEVSKEVKNQRKDQEKQTTQTTTTTTTDDPQIAIRANDKTAYNNAVVEMRKSKELWVFFKVPPYVYGEWRGPMMQNTLDAKRAHREALARQEAKDDKNEYTSQLGAYRNSLLASGLTASEIAEYFKPLPWQEGQNWKRLLTDAFDKAYRDWKSDQAVVAPPGVKTPEQLSQEAYDKFVLETEAALAKYPAGSYVMYWEKLPWFMGWDTDPDWLEEMNERYSEAASLGMQAQLDLVKARQVQAAAAPPRSQASLMDEAKFKSDLAAAIAQWGDDFVAPTYIEGNWKAAMDQQVQEASGKYADRVMAERRQQALADAALAEEERLIREQDAIHKQFLEQQALAQARAQAQAQQQAIDAEIAQADRDAYDDAKLDLRDEFPAERDLINLHMSGYRSDWRQFQGQLRSELINETSNKEREDRQRFNDAKRGLISQYPAASGQLNQWTYSPGWQNELGLEEQDAYNVQEDLAARQQREQDRINQQRLDEEEAYQQALYEERMEREREQRQRDIQRREAESRRQRLEAEAAQEVGDDFGGVIDLGQTWWQGDPSDDEPRFGGDDYFNDAGSGDPTDFEEVYSSVVEAATPTDSGDWTDFEEVYESTPSYDYSTPPDWYGGAEDE